MKTFICEICGDAYLGGEKPHSCPYCGARAAFIKEGKEAVPVVTVKDELSEISKKNLEETLTLEIKASGLYLRMANNADSYEIMKMYDRLSKVELEHANICIKLLKIKMPEVVIERSAATDKENFERTLELEDTAAALYREFAKTSTEKHVKILFAALAQAEDDHISLIKDYLN
jgi:rubrerythrin